MERFKNFCINAFSYPRLLYKTHPVSSVSIVITTLLFAIYTFIDSFRNWNATGFGMEVFFSVCMSFVFFSVFSLFVESLKTDWHRDTKAEVCALFALLSLFMGFIITDVSTGSHAAIFNMIRETKNSLGEVTVLLYIAGLVALSILLAVYFSYSHLVKQAFNVHTLNIFSKTFFTSIIYGVIQLGVIFLTLIVMLLLYDDIFSYLPTILVLINGLFYIPAVVYALTHENEHANMFMQVIVRYISLVITLIGFAIIYIYMIKLVVTASVPSNSVYAILTTLFIVSMFISYMSTSFEDTGFLQKFAYNCPLVFAPFILMQSYTIIVRIGQYGLTPKRYFGIAFILFEIVYIVVYTVSLKRDKEIAGRNILLIMCAFLIVSIFIPGISARSLSTTLAKRSLASYFEKTKAGVAISDKTLIRADAAHDYLSGDDFGKSRLAKYFPEITSDEISDLHSQAVFAKGKIREEEHDGNSYTPNTYGWYNTSINSLAGGEYLDISDYSRMVEVSIRSSKDGSRDPSDLLDPSNLYVVRHDTDSGDEAVLSDIPSVDLSDFVNDFNKLYADKDAGIISQDEYNSRCEQLCVIDIKENVRLLITNADIETSGENNTVYVNIDGLLLLR